MQKHMYINAQYIHVHVLVCKGHVDINLHIHVYVHCVHVPYTHVATKLFSRNNHIQKSTEDKNTR